MARINYNQAAQDARLSSDQFTDLSPRRQEAAVRYNISQQAIKPVLDKAIKNMTQAAQRRVESLKGDKDKVL